MSLSFSLTIRTDPLPPEVKAVKTGRWVNRRLEPSKKMFDHQPKRLGPNGTWLNDDESEAQTSIVATTSTVIPLKREDTLTD